MTIHLKSRPKNDENETPHPLFHAVLGIESHTMNDENETPRPLFRDVLERVVMETEAPEPDGQTALERMIRALTNKAVAGDLKAFEIVRDMLDGKPSDKAKPEPAIIAWEDDNLIRN